MRGTATKLNLFVVVAVTWKICYGAPQAPQTFSTSAPIPIIRYDSVPQTDGNYKWSYEGANGIQAQEEGFVKNPGQGDNEIQVAQGSFSYTSPEGQAIQMTYVADENGFVPVGNHIPTPPPIPPEILAVLEKNAADEAAGIFDDGKYRPDGAPPPRVQG